MSRAFSFKTLNLSLFRIASLANQKRVTSVTSKFLVATALFVGLLGNHMAHADPFFDVYVDLWDSGDVTMSPVDSGVYPFPPPPLDFPDLPTATGQVDIELVGLSLQSSAPMLVSPPDPTGRFTVDSFVDITYELVVTDSTGLASQTVDSFFDILYRMDVTPVDSSPNRRRFEIESIEYRNGVSHLIQLQGGGTIDLGLRLVEGQPAAADGHVTVLKLAGGGGGGGDGYVVDSFFDVFVDLSIDGGATYNPSQQNSQLRLQSHNQVPEPASCALLAFGLAVAACVNRRRKS